MVLFKLMVLVSRPRGRTIIYIGKSKTAKKRLGQCLGTHLNGQALQTYGATKKQVKNYLVRFVEVGNPKLRGYFEKFAICVVRPKYNKD